MKIKDAQFLVLLVYRSLDPATHRITADPYEILERGFAWCSGCGLVLGKLLDLVGQPWELWCISATMPYGAESHTFVVTSVEGKPGILDSTLGIVIPHGVEELREHPELADRYAAPDLRWEQRGYAEFLTPLWRGVHKAERMAS